MYLPENNPLVMRIVVEAESRGYQTLWMMSNPRQLAGFGKDRGKTLYTVGRVLDEILHNIPATATEEVSAS